MSAIGIVQILELAATLLILEGVNVPASPEELQKTVASLPYATKSDYFRIAIL